MINKDTKIYGSFSNNPGNNGCKFFNKKFQENNINAIYKSFYSNNIKKSIEAVKNLDIKGFAISMPFKVKILKYLDEIDEAVNIIGACNTVVNNKGKLKGYNTDWVGVLNFIKTNELNFTRIKQQGKMNIIGNGGFSKAIQYTCNILNIKYNVITRDKMNLVSNLEGITLNATPLDIKGVKQLIDCRPFTKQGKIIALLQAEEQYKIYTNVS